MGGGTVDGTKKEIRVSTLKDMINPATQDLRRDSEAGGREGVWTGYSTN